MIKISHAVKEYLSMAGIAVCITILTCYMFIVLTNQLGGV